MWRNSIVNKIETGQIVIKKNIFITLVQLILFIPALFTIPFLILLIPQFIFILFAPLPLTIMLAYLGYVAIIDLIKFKNKRLLIELSGITVFNRKKTTISWKEIKDIQLKNISDNYFLEITKNNQKKFSILISDTQLKYSVEEIYTWALSKWTENS
jgi:hypothetical protein